MKLEEIQKHQCNFGGRVGHYPLSHFQVGEQKCRHCNLFWKTTWTENRCPVCHQRLAHKARWH